eukprot:gnl/MRDRNA2_/MRDRNA2_155503_c0_seq1.p1 gnl/MRDRNA2_/MRDRNA2_155503_c0~~gnl/MRDRNA2_/MRDRNA2_155503_c0_seq1.p1  ORF type:complete len:498 (+),score=75.83 gnl/MRDRNA2_/MRDRNA2_155503_c0_seq1:79-1572(+)
MSLPKEGVIPQPQSEAPRLEKPIEAWTDDLPAKESSKTKLQWKFISAVVNTGWVKYHDKNNLHFEDYEDDDKKEDLSTPAGTMRTLINCFVSGGILGLAFQFKKSGSGTTMILLVVSAILIYITMMMLWDASVRSGTTGFVQTVHKLWGKRPARLALVSLLIEQLGTNICYFNILRDTLPRVLQQNIVGCVEVDDGCDVPVFLQAWFIIMLLTVFIVGPISCLSNPDVFSMISFVTWLHFGAFLVMVIIEAVTQVGNRGTFWPPEDGGPLQFNEAVFSTAAVIGFSMAAHSTLLAILYGTHLPKDEHKARQIIVKINGGSILTVLIYYFIVAACFFLAFGTAVQANALNSFPDDHVFMQVIRCTYTIEIGTSIPLFVYTLRRNSLILLFDLDGSQEEINKMEKAKKPLMLLLTFLILLLSAIAGIALQLDIILAFSGAICATMNSFILPAGMFWTAEKDGPSAGSARRVYVAPAMIVFGVALGALSLSMEIKGLAQR